MEATSGLDQSPEQNLNRAEGRSVTAKDVEQARLKEKKANIQLMDDMEGSVKTQGEWFVKLGKKSPITEQQTTQQSRFMGLGNKEVSKEVTTGYDDNRALVLKAIARIDDGGIEEQEFTVVTADGIFVAPFFTSSLNTETNNNSENQRKFQALKALTEDTSGVPSAMEYKTISNDTGYPIRKISLDSHEGTYGGITLVDPVDRHSGSMFNAEVFDQRVRESIAKTESPYKKQLKAVEEKAELSSRAAVVINSLPPRE